MELAALSWADFVMLAGDRLVTDSLKVAKHFKWSHKNVLRKIDAVLTVLPEEFSRLNFEPRDYVDERGRERRHFEMTKDGFMFLVMGFTGKAAALIKLSFILAFNAMADALMDGADVVKRRQWLIDLNASSATAAALHGKGLAMRGIQKREIEAELSCLGVQFPLFPSSLLPSVVEFATMGRLRLH